MRWYHLLSYFFGGVFVANAIPHYVAGVLGRPLQSPFASPPFQGLSSSRVNVFWGGCNLVVAYVLLAHVGVFKPADVLPMGAAGAGFFLMSLTLAQKLGHFHGGNAPAA